MKKRYVKAKASQITQPETKPSVEDLHDMSHMCTCNPLAPFITNFDELEHIPHKMRTPMIYGFYRAHYSFKDALLSLFTWHNETINIWTALLPFLLFLFYTFEVYTMPMDNAIEKTCLIVLALACVCSFGSSTLFHWFGCVDEWYSQLIRFDIAMIAVLICGSYYPPMYYAFYCEEHFFYFYLSVITLLCLACVVCVMLPKFTMEEYRIYRVLAFSGTTAFGMVPMIHIIWSLDKIRRHIDGISDHIGLIFAMYGLYLIGVIIYATRIPERFAPRKFDILFSSHQFWHLFVFLAALIHFLNCLSMHDPTFSRFCEKMHSVEQVMATNSSALN